MESKFLTKKSYEHRSYFFKTFGDELVHQAVEKYSKLYPILYSSAAPIKNDFTNENLFNFIEKSLSEKINSDFTICQDHGLLRNYQLKFFSRQKREKLINQNFAYSMYDNFPFYPTGIPLNIRELLDENKEILENYYKSCIDCHIEQFYIRGATSKYWIALDTIYRDGFNKHLHRFGNKSSVEIDEDLQRFTEGGIYGLLKKADLYTTYKTINNQYIKVQLLKFCLDEPVKTNTLLHYLDLSPIEYLPDERNLDKYINSQYEPINKVRELLNFPRIGEGWISETKLYYQLKQYFEKDVVLQHVKPKWLGRQHFDIYFPLLNIAVEYQGKQHFEPISKFGGKESFIKNIERDQRKKNLSEKNNCDLFYVEPGYNLNELIDNIRFSKNYINNSNNAK